MKFSWTYILQLVSASLLVGRISAAPVAEPEAEVKRALGVRDGDRFIWSIDEMERIYLSELLGIDFSSLGITGVVLDGPKMKCEGCGKRTGLDDLVQNALEDGIHSKQFIIKELEARGPNPGTAHEIRCSTASCGRTHVEKRRWSANWIA